jgi:ABC-2 type transport system ATP-binding protein
MPENIMIEVSNLTKNYGYIKAVDDISFQVSKGEILGFLGPNGAGKTTTMKILTCYMLPTFGKINIAGFNIYNNSLEIRKRIGYLPETAPLYYDMQVDEFLKFIADIREIPKAKKNKRLKEIIEVCGLKKVGAKFIGELSKGYKQRVGLAQALIHNPDILILDEPTSGLDPNQIIEIRNLIKTIGQEKTIILSTHILPEVEATCNRVIIINNGKIIGDDKPEMIGRDETGKVYTLKVITDNSENFIQLCNEAEFIDAVKEISFANKVGEYKLYLKKKELESGVELFKFLNEKNFDIFEMKLKEESLEEVFHKLTT